jgi:hypothetical protein
VRGGGLFAHVGRDRRIDVSNQINAIARTPDAALDDLTKLHFLVVARYEPEQTTLGVLFVKGMFRIGREAAPAGQETSGSLPNL